MIKAKVQNGEGAGESEPAIRLMIPSRQRWTTTIGENTGKAAVGDQVKRTRTTSRSFVVIWLTFLQRGTDLHVELSILSNPKWSEKRGREVSRLVCAKKCMNSASE
jgi:hypothetical protein